MKSEKQQNTSYQQAETAVGQLMEFLSDIGRPQEEISKAVDSYLALAKEDPKTAIACVKVIMGLKNEDAEVKSSVDTGNRALEEKNKRRAAGLNATSEFERQSNKIRSRISYRNYNLAKGG